MFSLNNLTYSCSWPWSESLFYPCKTSVIIVIPTNSELHWEFSELGYEWVIWDFPLFSQELDKMLADTPAVWKGSSNLFRNLREGGKELTGWNRAAHRNPLNTSHFPLRLFLRCLIKGPFISYSECTLLYSTCQPHIYPEQKVCAVNAILSLHQSRNQFILR